jgi:hypothetical protein
VARKERRERRLGDVAPATPALRLPRAPQSYDPEALLDALGVARQRVVEASRRGDERAVAEAWSALHAVEEVVRRHLGARAVQESELWTRRME